MYTNTQEVTRYDVLIVDDNSAHRALQKEILDDEKYFVIEAENGEVALEKISQQSFDIVLLDKRMPGMNGDEVCYRIRTELDEALLPIVMVTGDNSPEDLAKSMKMGATDFIKKPYIPSELLARVDAAVQRKRLTDQLDNSESLLFALARMVEAKDSHTGDHCSRLAYSSGIFARKLGLDQADITALRRGAILHDIGKLGIPDKVLLKEGKLTVEEFELIKNHSVIGARLCGDLKSMQSTLPIIRHHHERWNGSGYPDGLKGNDIPYLARVFQILDVYDALSSERPYKTAFTTEQVIEIFEKEKNQDWYDPELMEVFLTILRTQPDVLKLPDEFSNDAGEQVFNDIAATGVFL